ncbi:MEGF8 [Cordylochernes scorpioides]|uniref:MEGF8 n=1 Tax=Cordylochernes scorpioides TaxID=51811 RepID=A0ABY6KQB1_9ARAC|nr:MEGF8 [Cordylochernes scorpioides]
MKMIYTELKEEFWASLHAFPHSTLLWLFGGYSLPQEAHSNQLWVFNISQPAWEVVTPSGESNGLPPKRHFHAATLMGPHLYIHGGLGAEGVLWSDFWRFHTQSLAWSPLNAGEVPPLAGHTLTPLSDGGSLLLVGGYSPNYGFLEKVLLFNTTSMEWGTFNTSGAPPIGIYGHSAVLREDTLYLYGGVVFGRHRPAVASHLHALHLPSRRWTRLPPDRALNSHPPAAAYLHSVLLPTSHRHMVLLGAGTPLTFYSFPCNLWIFPQLQDGPRQDVGSRAVLGSDHAVWMLTDTGLHRLKIPPDLCSLFSSSQQDCLRHHGCSFCSAYEASSNSTYCYSEPELPSSCSNPKGTSELVRGVVCTPNWLSDRECYQYSSCVDCVAFWPAINSSAQVCQWCSNCQVGRCIPQGASCEKENDCNVPQRVVGQPGACPRHVCLASDCSKCGALPGDNCMWTRQVLRASEWGHTLNVRPIFDWACVRKMIQEASSFPVESMPPLNCPALCPAHMDCAACTSSSGGEGGWSHCHWSSRLRQCVSPSFEPLACVGGRCGTLLAQCPSPCWANLQASHCLRNPACGWCHFTGVDGRGVCLPGSMEGPLNGAACSAQSVHLPDGVSLPEEVVKWLAMSQEPPQWSYLEIPPENECTNGHHNCIAETEDCKDLRDGYKCVCKKGFTQDPSDVCVPVCRQGCRFGTCIAPNECKCHFGFVGKNCSVLCQCNRHSQCAGPERLDECLDCQNNTQGPQCQQCKPFFVGNPVNGGRCLPCRVYCNGHSEVCLSPEQYNLSSPSLTEHILDSLTAGPVEDAVCLDCHNATEGPRCDQCLPGYFKAGDSIKDGCRPYVFHMLVMCKAYLVPHGRCECHGHGDMCNPLNGENCNCHNNTENDRQCSQKTSKTLSTPCWQLQCSKCKEYFVGVPTHGHQCYRHMFLDKDYCFDPYTQGTYSHSTLGWMLFCDAEQCNRKPNPLPEGRTVFFAVQPRYMNVDIRIIVDVTEGAIDFFLSARDDTFLVTVNQSTGVHEVKLEETNQTLVGRRVEARGADHLPHHLGLQGVLVSDSVKFFMVLYGASRHPTFGSLFFRQDQTRIDLFVFFSVFFSCFFLFLAQCVIMWKVKQAFDLRRARRQHAAEMKHMANRPFGRVAVIVEDKEVEELFCYTPPSTFSWKRSRHKVRDSPKTSPALLLSTDKFCTVWPVAVEPASDNFAGVASVLVQLPGGPNAPVKMCLGSALVTLRSCHQRARRRTS